MANVQHYLRFRVGYEWYGIEVDSLIEVLHFVALSELPAARPDILGMMRLRETVVPVIDLRLRFGLEATYNLNTPIVVARTPGGATGLVVDDVDDLVRITVDQVSAQQDGPSPYVAGTARLSDSLLLLLDLGLLREELPAHSPA